MTILGPVTKRQVAPTEKWIKRSCSTSQELINSLLYSTYGYEIAMN